MTTPLTVTKFVLGALLLLQLIHLLSAQHSLESLKNGFTGVHGPSKHYSSDLTSKEVANVAVMSTDSSALRLVIILCGLIVMIFLVLLCIFACVMFFYQPVETTTSGNADVIEAKAIRATILNTNQVAKSVPTGITGKTAKTGQTGKSSTKGSLGKLKLKLANKGKASLTTSIKLPKTKTKSNTKSINKGKRVTVATRSDE